MNIDQARESLKKFLPNTENGILAIVESVNKTDCICAVKLVSNSDLIFEDVRLRAITDGENTGLIIFPKVGSYVILGSIDNSENSYYIAICSEIDTFKLENDTESLATILSDLLTAIKAITVPTNVGPSGIPINIADFTAIGTRLDSILE